MSILKKIQNRLMRFSREQKLRQFYSLFKEGETVLDVGVSPESNRAKPARNYFLKNYRYKPETYTGLGVRELIGMEGKFPGKKFVQYSGGKFPFADKEFDWVFSNAVIEHVGDDRSQLLFLNEMMRVSKNVFFTTPNKYFPIESHTSVFFLHWHDDLFYKWCGKNKPAYDRDSLYLFSFKRLEKMVKRSRASSFAIYQNRFIGLPMTFSVTCTNG
ncbi:methyltransferase domain-containing protein [Synechococcus sp. PCC 7336]|uniref:methyltransferase domain-containing protein n=1 Tax=Synechococcus sp. PCC 7336 TaxID=195250 RepID=UPI00056F225F|nr:methyltransferase domain-containing protein [Synechococcus sp. PCC 7336]